MFGRFLLFFFVVFALVRPVAVWADEENMFNIEIKGAPQLSSVSLQQILNICPEKHPLLQIANEDLRISMIKYEDVAKKKFLYTLKLVNAGELENALKHEVQVYENAKQKVKSEIISEITKKYYKLIEALMIEKLASQMVVKAKTQMESTKILVEEGKAVKLDFEQAKIYLLNAEQKLLESEAAYNIASTELISYANINTNSKLVMPQEFNKEDEKVTIDPLNLINPHEDLELLIQYALQHRSDVKQQKESIQYLEHIKNTVGTDKLKIEEVESNKTKEEIKLNMLKENVPVIINAALLNLEISENKIETSQKELDLASITLDKVNLSYSERYSTLKDLQDASVNLVDKKAKHIKAIMDYNNAQIELLKQIGAISTASIVTNKKFQLKHDDKHHL